MKFKKKLLFVALILIVLFTLSGCSMSVPVADWLSVGEFVSDKAAEAYRNYIEYGLINFFGSLKCSIMNLMYSLSDINIASRSMLSNFNQMAKVIGFVQIFAVVAIIIQFARGIWKSYFSTADNQYAPTLMSLLRKLLVAIFATILIPGAMITAFITTTYIGTLSTQVLRDVSHNESGVAVTNTYIFEEMEKDQVSMSTYCSKGQLVTDKVKESGLKSLAGWEGKDSLKGAEKFEIINEEKDKTLHQKYCDWTTYIDNGVGSLNESAYPGYDSSKHYPRTVGEAIRYSNGASNVLLFGAYESMDVLLQEASENALTAINPPALTGSAVTVLIRLLIMILFAVASIFFLFATAKRIVDLFVLILMSWWYIGASVSDSPQQSSLGELGKKLLSICMTQFIMTIEICLFINIVILDPVWNFWTLIIVLAWVFVLWGTPSAVQEMVTDTGTGGEASGAVKSVGKGVKNLLG